MEAPSRQGGISSKISILQVRIDSRSWVPKIPAYDISILCLQEHEVLTNHGRYKVYTIRTKLDSVLLSEDVRN